MNRRAFLRNSATAAFFAAALSLTAAPVGHFIQAESFDDPGGWVIDTQFIEVMGSPYLIAHRMGKPVRDATTSVAETGGKFRIWVRTKNWVGPWDAPQPPGRFQMTVNGHPLGHTFGAAGKDWMWEDGGMRKADPANYANYTFDWLAYIGGTRNHGCSRATSC